MEYDVLIYDCANNEYYAFEIKYTSEACIEQEKHLNNERFKEVVDR